MFLIDPRFQDKRHCRAPTLDYRESEAEESAEREK
jgi:hypothetical protein